MTLAELYATNNAISSFNSSSALLLLSTPDRKASIDAGYIIDSLIRDIEHERRKPDIVGTGRVLNAEVSGSMLFDEEEIVRTNKSIKPMTDLELLANATPYEEDLIFLNAELDGGFIDQEQYKNKLEALKIEHGLIKT